jgi:putative phosphoesterase
LWRNARVYSLSVRALLSAAFDLEFVLGLSIYVTGSIYLFEPKATSTGGGQECPPHATWFLQIPNALIIGVISDTHGLLRPEALAALRGSDYIIHAGDIGKPDILKQLAEIAPVTAIRGNVDRDAWADMIPAADVLEVGGVSIYVRHKLHDLDLKPEGAGFSVVVYGHSHVARQETKNAVLYFNPGSAGPRRFRLPVTIGRLMVKDGKISGEILEISPGAG